MKENRDPAIKLFGKKIPLLVDNETPVISGDSEPLMASNSLDREKSNKGEEKEEEEVKDSLAGKASECMEEDDSTPANTEEDFRTPETLPESNATPKTPSINEENENSKTLKTQKEQDDTEEKILKKPDKILPCPRCNSMDTKFCYYNNYNINQPRHFCKSCQRYWTAGGTMRNMPVGAGRRKNKNHASHYRHITISEALQAARLDAPNGIHHPILKSNNGRVVSFGMNVPVCDSMATSVLNLADKRGLNGTRNKFHKFEGQGIPVPSKSGENGDDCSGGSSMTLSNSTEQGGRNGQQEPLMHNINSFPSQIPCLPGVPWPCPWNSSVPPPVFCPPGFPMPIYPAAYWNCGMTGTWNIPLLSPQSPSPNQMATSGPNSPLGKHSRDGEVRKPDNSEEEEPSKQKNGRVLVPKTLRIDDPTEAAKSSIWATLGIKNESLSKGGWFKALQSKGNEKNHISETSIMLQANPAALSRSLNFHEVS